MGFIDITLIDIIDILVVALIMFQIYRLTPVSYTHLTLPTIA